MSEPIDVANEKLRRARELAGVGDYERALVEYFWCLDHGVEHQPSFAAVRISFLLGDIYALGDRYPPAIQGLRERRNTLSNAVFSGAGTEQEILLFAALNRELGEDRKTLEAYEHLRERAPRVGDSVGALLPYVVDLLLERRRYADVLQAAGDVDAMIDHLIRRAELHSEMFTPSDSTPAWYGATARRLRQSAVDE